MAKLTKFPDAGQFSCAYYVGMDALLLTHRTSRDHIWINGGDINALEQVLREVQSHREECHASAEL